MSGPARWVKSYSTINLYLPTLTQLKNKTQDQPDMIKLTFCLHRKPGLTLEEFQDYWLNNHAPLVKSHAKALRIQRYVQAHSSDPAFSDAVRKPRAGDLNKAPEIFDGVAQLWFNSFEDMAVSSNDPAAIQAGKALLEDEAKFIDLASSPLWFSQEHEIF